MEGICTFSDWFINGGMGDWMDYDKPKVGFDMAVGLVIATPIICFGLMFFDLVIYNRYCQRRRSNRRRDEQLYEINGYIEEMEREIAIAEREENSWTVVQGSDSEGSEGLGIGLGRGMGEGTERGRPSTPRALWKREGDKCGEHGEMDDVKEVRRRPEKGCAEVCCSICLDDMGEDRRQTIETCCGHQYHRVCFDKVVLKEGDWYKCPNCRHERPVLVRTRFLKG